MSNKCSKIKKSIKKPMKNGLMFPLDMYGSTIGSFAVAYWMCGQARSHFYLKKMFKVLQKQMPEFKDYKELISKLKAAYDCPNVDLPIVAVASDTGSLLFTVIVDGLLIPNREDGIPLGCFLHPQRVFDLRGNEVLQYKYIKNLHGDIEEVNKEEKKDVVEEKGVQ